MPHTKTKPSLAHFSDDELQAELHRRHRRRSNEMAPSAAAIAGWERAAELDLMNPCTVVWCAHSCHWEADFVGGAVSRDHEREWWPSGLTMGVIETPEGFEGPVWFTMPEYGAQYRCSRPPSDAGDATDAEDATLIEARWLAADLTAALTLVDGEPK